MASFTRVERSRTRTGVPVSIYCMADGGRLYVPLVARWQVGYAVLLHERVICDAAHGRPPDER